MKNNAITKIGLEIEVGVRWQCKHCDHRQKSVGDEEWQFHCNDTMRMIPFYKFHPIITKEEKNES